MDAGDTRAPDPSSSAAGGGAVTTAPALDSPDGGRGSSVMAWSLCAVSLALVGIFVWLEVRHHQALGPSELAFDGHSALFGLCCPPVGALIAVRRRGNPIGWLLLVSGISLAASAVAHADSQWTSLVGPDAPVAGQLVAWVGGWVWVPGWTLLPTLLLLLFPDGRLPSPRWRWAAWTSVAALVGLVVGSMIGNPLVAAPGGPMLLIGGVLMLAGLPLALVSAIACLIGLVVRYRRSRGDERQQIKWFAYAGIAFIVLLPANSVLSQTSPILEVLAFAAVPLLPLGIAVSVLKYRLYDIDIVISKTLVYGTLAGFITAVYVVIVLGLGGIVAGAGKSNLLVSILATAVVALSFGPVKDRVQRFANHLVYGKRATPYEVLSEFSAQVAGSSATEQLLPRMAQILAEGTGAGEATVWLKVGTELRAQAVWPSNGATAVEKVDASASPSLIPGTLVLGIHHQGELLGAISITKPPGARLTPAEDKLAKDLAAGAGPVFRNVRLAEELIQSLDELRASRTRIVAAADEARRRLERDIHDGAQQQLVALAIRLRMARRLAATDPTKADGLLEQATEAAVAALDDLRDLARGIYPPLLADRGLTVALEAQARTSSLAVTVAADGVGRYTQEIEAAAYFTCLEALQNEAKYAGASAVSLGIGERAEELTCQVSDDGHGFDPSVVKHGTGLQGIADRLSALGGALDVRSAPGKGTVLTARLPVRRQAAPVSSDGAHAASSPSATSRT